MAAADRKREPVREFQLEGLGLVLVGALVVGGLLAAFFAGRWYERQQHPAIGAARASGNPVAHVEMPDEVVDVADSASFFDVVEGGEKQAEPEREAARPPAAADAEETPPPPAARPNAAPGGPFFVQVFAGRDQGAAAGLLDKLEREGHPALLHTDRQGSSTLFKVRVGGFATQARAREAADGLQAEGYSGAWVTRVD